MYLFGRAKAKTTPKETLVHIKETIEMLDKKEKYFQQRADKEMLFAKQNATKNRRSALMALKRKRQFEAQSNKIMQQKYNLEVQIMALENATVTMETMNAMKTGAEAMKVVHGKMNIDEVDQAVEEVRDQMEMATEIANAISQDLGPAMDFDEDELNAELEELEQRDLEVKLLGTQTPAIDVGSEIPAVPEGEIADAPRRIKEEAMTEEDKELLELQNSMTM